MEPHHIFAQKMGFGHHIHHFFQGHFCAVVDLAAFFGIGKQLGIHQATRIDDHIGLAQQTGSPHSNQIGGAGARPYNGDHLPHSFITMVVK